MFTSTYLDKTRSSLFFYELPTIKFSFSEIVNRIKDIAIVNFEKFSNLFNSYDNPRNENNVKAFALICCFSLIIFLFLSTMTRGESNILPPATPASLKKGKQ